MLDYILHLYIIKTFSSGNTVAATKMCRSYFEISYVSTGVLCFAALSSAPQFMKLLYSNKYTAGLAIFCVYILVDLARITNLTIIISSAGKSKWLMIMGGGSIAVNALLNFVLYDLIGLMGPAVATLIVTAVTGMIMIYLDSRVLKAKLTELIDFKYLLLFMAEAVVLTVALSFVGHMLDAWDVHYFINLVLIAGAYVLIMLLLNFKRVIANMKKLNSLSKEEIQENNQ